jgi:hypothetical protein
LFHGTRKHRSGSPMAAQLLELFHCSKSLFDLANYKRTQGITWKVERPYKIRVWSTNWCRSTNQAGPTQLDTWFGSLNCCVENHSQVTVISFWRKGSRRLNATERAGLWIHKTKQFSEQRHRNCLRAMKVRVNALVHCGWQNYRTTKVVLPVSVGTKVQYSNRVAWWQKQTTAHNTTWTFSSFKIVSNWKHRTHPFFCFNHQPESTAPQLSERNKGESRRIGVLLKTESLHDKQGCTTVSASTEVQYWHRMDWRQKRTTAHNTTWAFPSFKIVPNWKHRTHPLFCIYHRQRWISEMSLEGTNFRMTRIHNALSVGGDCVIASTLCDQVCKKYVQIQVGTRYKYK